MLGSLMMSSRSWAVPVSLLLLACGRTGIDLPGDTVADGTLDAGDADDDAGDGPGMDDGVAFVDPEPVPPEPRPETCGNTNGAAWCSVSGGQPPYTYAWTGPNGYTATTDSIFDLVGGTYSIKLEGRDKYVEMIANGFHSQFVGQHNGHHPEIDFISETEAKGLWYLADIAIDNCTPAGDAMVAGVIAARLRHLPLHAVAAFATACSASAISAVDARLDRGAVEALATTVHVTPKPVVAPAGSRTGIQGES